MPCSVANTFVDENGLLFLPAAGQRNGTEVTDYLDWGRYYSRTSGAAGRAHVDEFSAAYGPELGGPYRYLGFSVRLVCLAQ